MALSNPPLPSPHPLRPRTPEPEGGLRSGSPLRSGEPLQDNGRPSGVAEGAPDRIETEAAIDATQPTPTLPHNALAPEADSGGVGLSRPRRSGELTSLLGDLGLSDAPTGIEAPAWFDRRVDRLERPPSREEFVELFEGRSFDPDDVPGDERAELLRRFPDASLLLESDLSDRSAIGEFHNLLFEEGLTDLEDDEGFYSDPGLAAAILARHSQAVETMTLADVQDRVLHRFVDFRRIGRPEVRERLTAAGISADTLSQLEGLGFTAARDALRVNLGEEIRGSFEPAELIFRLGDALDQNGSDQSFERYSNWEDQGDIADDALDPSPAYRQVDALLNELVLDDDETFMVFWNSLPPRLREAAGPMTVEARHEARIQHRRIGPAPYAQAVFETSYRDDPLRNNRPSYGSLEHRNILASEATILAYYRAARAHNSSTVVTSMYRDAGVNRDAGSRLRNSFHRFRSGSAVDFVVGGGSPAHDALNGHLRSLDRERTVFNSSVVHSPLHLHIQFHTPRTLVAPSE